MTVDDKLRVFFFNAGEDGGIGKCHPPNSRNPNYDVYLNERHPLVRKLVAERNTLGLALVAAPLVAMAHVDDENLNLGWRGDLLFELTELFAKLASARRVVEISGMH